jgi:hypothetical protein
MTRRITRVRLSSVGDLRRDVGSEHNIESGWSPTMDKAVAVLVEVVLQNVSEKGLENIDLWYLVSLV